MNWTDIPDEVKKLVFSFTGGFKNYHSELSSGFIKSIKRREREHICYICGLQNSFLKDGLSRHPSTRMYVRSDCHTVEIFGKCQKHHDDHPIVDGVLLPLNIETDEEILQFISSIYPRADRVFIFTTHEDDRSGWRIINCSQDDQLSNRYRNSFG